MMRLASICLSLFLHLSVAVFFLYFSSSLGLRRLNMESHVYTVELVNLVHLKPKLAPRLPRLKRERESAAAKLVKLPRKIRSRPAKDKAVPIPDKNTKRSKAKKRASKPKIQAPDTRQIVAQAMREVQLSAKKEKIREEKLLARELASLKHGTPVPGQGVTSRQLIDNYAGIIKEKIKNKWRSVSLGNTQNLQTDVLIQIDVSGRIVSYKLIRPSGNLFFDASIKKAIEDTKKLPAPPGNVRQITITFNPNELQ